MKIDSNSKLIVLSVEPLTKIRVQDMGDGGGELSDLELFSFD